MTELSESLLSLITRMFVLDNFVLKSRSYHTSQGE
jgi:hypothetical protein